MREIHAGTRCECVCLQSVLGRYVQRFHVGILHSRRVDSGISRDAQALRSGARGTNSHPTRGWARGHGVSSAHICVGSVRVWDIVPARSASKGNPNKTPCRASNGESATPCLRFLKLRYLAVPARLPENCRYLTHRRSDRGFPRLASFSRMRVVKARLTEPIPRKGSGKARIRMSVFARVVGW